MLGNQFITPCQVMWSWIPNEIWLCEHPGLVDKKQQLTLPTYVLSWPWESEKIPLTQNKSSEIGLRQTRAQFRLCQISETMWKIKTTIRTCALWNSTWNVSTYLHFRRPMYRVFPFHSILVQTCINCWAITTGSQSVSPTHIRLHCRTYSALLSYQSSKWLL